MSYAATNLCVEYPPQARQPAGVQPVVAALRACEFFAGWSPKLWRSISINEK